MPHKKSGRDHLLQEWFPNKGTDPGVIQNTVAGIWNNFRFKATLSNILTLIKPFLSSWGYNKCYRGCFFLVSRARKHTIHTNIRPLLGHCPHCAAVYKHSWIAFLKFMSASK